MRNSKTASPRPNLLLLSGGLVLFLLCCVNFFLHLDQAPIANWDEARHGISAYEMLQSGDYLVNTYRNAADYWNVKPPLSFWAIAASFKLFGVSVFGFRFVSALCTLLTTLLVVLFAGKRHSWSTGLLAGGLLATTDCFVHDHNARSGDPDALFILLTTSAVFAALQAKIHVRWLYLSCGLLALGFLTKSFHVGPPLLAVAGLALWIRGREIFRLRVFGLCLLCGLTPVLLWAAARYSVDGTVFFEKMWHLDAYTRTTIAIEDHAESYMYYLHILKSDFGLPVLVLIVWLAWWMFYAFPQRCAAKNLFQHADKTLLCQLAFCTIPTLVLFQCSASKLSWYLYPISPFIVILLGAALSVLFRNLWSIGTSNYSRIALVCSLIFFFGFQEYQLGKNILKQTQQHNPVQQALREAGQHLHGVAVYLEHNDWEQKNVLAAKIYGNFLPLDGGVEAWKKDKNDTAIVLSTNGDYLTKLR